MLRVREAKETPAEYLTIELLLSGEADLPAMAAATAVAMPDCRELLALGSHGEDRRLICLLFLGDRGLSLASSVLTMDTMIHDVVARGGLQKRHRGQQFSQAPPA